MISPLLIQKTGSRATPIVGSSSKWTNIDFKLSPEKSPLVQASKLRIYKARENFLKLNAVLPERSPLKSLFQIIQEEENKPQILEEENENSSKFESQNDEKLSFFEMVVKVVLHNQPKWVVKDFNVAHIDAKKMYTRAMELNLEYHQFIEWVEHDIRMQIFKDFDTLFKQAEIRQQR